MISSWTINSKPKGIRNYVTNSFLTNMSQSIITKYNDLPANSLLRHSNSFVANRMKMSFTDVIKTLYGLNKNNIKNVFHIPDKLDVPGIYCFLSKDGSSFYIGSSVNMKNRYNRHMSNLKHIDKRNSLANPKFYNYVRKYGMDALDFGCLLVTKNYLVMYSGFNLTPAEISLLKSLIQWDLLITEQYFLDLYGISLNVATYVGTRESSILSDETRKKMSVAHMNLETTLSKDKWEAIRTKAKETWGNDPLDSARRKAISVTHGRSVIVKDSDHNIIADFTSQLKAAEYLGISRNRIGRYLNTGTLLDSKVGSVYITDKGQVKPRSIEIQVLDVDRNILDTCSSVRATAVKYNIAVSSLSATYLNKDKLYKNKYYFVSDSNTS